MKFESHEPDRPLSNSKTRERAFILPLVGLLLLTPPLAGIFQLDLRLMGIPFTAIYLFAVWSILIAGAAILARHLQKSGEWENADTESADEANENTR